MMLKMSLEQLQREGWCVARYGYHYTTRNGHEHRQYIARALYPGEAWEERKEQEGWVVLETGEMVTFGAAEQTVDVGLSRPVVPAKQYDPTGSRGRNPDEADSGRTLTGISPSTVCSAAPEYRALLTEYGFRVQQEGWLVPPGLPWCPAGMHHLAIDAAGKMFNVDLQTGRWNASGTVDWCDWPIRALEETPQVVSAESPAAPVLVQEPSRPFVSLRDKPVTMRGAKKAQSLF